MHQKRGVSRFSVEISLSHIAEKFRRGINYCCSFFGYRKSLDKKRGVSRFSVEKVLFHSAKKIAGEHFSGSLIFGIEKIYASEGYVTIFDFLSEVYCLTVPKISVGESFTVALISGIQKVWIREGGVSRYSVEIFLFHKTEKLLGGIL